MSGGLGCGGGAAGGIPVPPGSAFAIPGIQVGVDANRDGVIQQNERSFIPMGGAMAGGGMMCGSGAAGGGIAAGGGMAMGGGAASGGMIAGGASGAMGGGGLAMGGGGTSGGMAMGGGGGMAMGGGMGMGGGADLGGGMAMGGGTGMGMGGGMDIGAGAAMGGGMGGGMGVASGPGAFIAGPLPGGGAVVGVDADHNGRFTSNEIGVVGAGGGGGGSGGNDISDAEADAYIRTVTTYKTVAVPVTRNKYRVVNYSVPQTVPYTDFETVTRTRTITKQVPKTIMVPVQTQEPYQTSVPVTKQKVIMVPRSRTTCTPETKIVSRRVPVVNVVPKPPPPCPPGM